MKKETNPMPQDDPTRANPFPSPLGGERARVRGARSEKGVHRTRTSAAKNFARLLRQKSTSAEQALWRLLRDRRFADFKFRRQYPCGIYFLDFYCVTAKLAVELDGGGHGFPGRRARDEVRNAFLAAKGIKVLRFWNHQMRGELSAVRFAIWHELMARTGQAQRLAGFLPKPGTPSP
jgi:adenine-specific DNA-methyltransferase